jgi:hypothetical protein
MRITWGLCCALALAACTSADHGSSKSVDAPSGFICGDGICAAAEVNTCPQDCGTTGGQINTSCGDGTCNGTETPATCPQDCSTGGQGSNTGSGSGSGAVNCSDQNTVLACFGCLLANTCMPPLDAATCQSCLGAGLGSGSGLGSACPTGCNCDGVCDPGETSAACPLDNCP